MIVHEYRCQSCGRTVSLGATCECNVVLADDRIAAALERIATALERSVPPALSVAIAGDGEGVALPIFDIGQKHSPTAP